MPVNTLHHRRLHDEPPLPLAGEGWGEGKA